jgi:acetylglutamate kinase
MKMTDPAVDLSQLTPMESETSSQLDDKALNEKGLGKEKVAGYRITTAEVFEVVQSVLSGTVLRSIVNYLIGSEVNAVGLSASDGGLIRAKKFKPVIDGKSIDIGFVGQVAQTNPMILESLITEGYLQLSHQ